MVTSFRYRRPLRSQTGWVYFYDEAGTLYILRVNDSGQLLWMRSASVSPTSLFNETDVFWNTVVPVLTGIADRSAASFNLVADLYVQASFDGTYVGTGGHTGRLDFQWRSAEWRKRAFGTPRCRTRSLSSASFCAGAGSRW